MRRLLFAFSILLIIISAVFMLTFIILPAVIPFDSLPPLKATYQVLFCKPDETLTESTTTYRPSPGTTITNVNMACVNRAGQARDLDQAPVSVGAIGYFGTFLPGLFLSMATRAKKQAPTSTYSSALSAAPLQRTDSSSSLAGLGMTATSNDVGNVMTSEGSTFAELQALVGKTSSIGSRLENLTSATTRMKELKSALEAGLITQTEYEAKRQEILREM
jgi:Short C-terminal domain